MEKKIKQISSLHGFVFTTLLILPIVWSASMCNDVQPIEVGPGASPDHLIPANGNDVKSWFSKTILHAKERKGTIKDELLAAEAKTEIIKVRSDGSGDFKTVKEALDSAIAKGMDNRVVIDIGPGVYNEKITIDRPYVTLYGDPEVRPSLTYDERTPSVESPTETSTLIVKAQYFSAVNLGILNVANLKDDQVGYAVTITANYASFYNCDIGAMRSVIYDNLGNHFFKDCVITGSTNIIIGEGRSIYLDSMIRVRKFEPASIIAGQLRLIPDPRGGGFVFAHCSVVGEKNAKAFLGRTDLSYARVLYAYSELSDAIEPKGWLGDSDINKEKTGFFGEYENTGVGADTSQRINRQCSDELTQTNVQPFLSLDFINAAEWLLPAPGLVKDTL